MSRFVGPNGLVQIRLVHGYIGSSSANLISRWDLFQLVRAGGVEVATGAAVPDGGGGVVAGLSSQPQGADTNLNGELAIDDVDMFLEENAMGSPAGDYNGDSAADATDVDEFVTDFVGG